MPSGKLGGQVLDPFGYTWPGSLVPYTDITGRTPASAVINPNERTLTVIIEGQSLGAAHIPAAYTVQNPTKIHCVNWAGDRLLYQHKEPIFGASFFEAGHIPGNNWDFPYISQWGAVADLLINGGVTDRVILLNTAIGGAQVDILVPGGVFGQRIPVAFRVLRSLGITGNQVSAILSMIGESDNIAGTSVETYKAHRHATARVARSYGFTGPWFTPLESYAKNVPPSATIRQAQAELAAEAGFALGPDYDVLGSEYRDFNGTHQNAVLPWAQMYADVLATRFG